MYRDSTLVFGALAVVVILTAIMSYDIGAPQKGGPPTSVETRIDVPMVDVQNDGDSTRIRAPFVDIDVRKDKTQPDD